MDFIYNLNLEDMTGIPSDVFILGLAALICSADHHYDCQWCENE